MIISALLLITALVVFQTIYDSFKYTFLSTISSPARAENKDRSLPTFIHIPSVEIALPVEETTINFGIWEVKQNSASHLASSAIPNEQGNIIFYAKKTDDQFSRLTSLQKGDSILVSTYDGDLHEYIVADLLIVSPYEVSPVRNSEKEVLTLYTSYGFGDLKRFVVKARPILN